MFWVLDEWILINTIANTNIILENNFRLLFANLIFSRFHLNSPAVLSPSGENQWAVHMHWGLFWRSWGPGDLRGQIRYEISGFPICLESFQDILILLCYPSPGIYQIWILGCPCEVYCIIMKLNIMRKLLLLNLWC